jgi:hypothetical protein
MRRFSVLVAALLALLASGCFGESATSNPSVPSDTSPASQERGKVSVDVRLRQFTAFGAARDQTIHVSCPPVDDLALQTRICQRITAPGSDYFGAPTSFTMPAGGTGNVTISGSVNGVGVKKSYRLGSSPQYPNWTRLFQR